MPSSLPGAEPNDLSGHEYLQPILRATGYVWRPDPRTHPRFPSATQLLKRSTSSRPGMFGREPEPEPAHDYRLRYVIYERPTILLELPPERIGRGQRYRPAALITETPHSAFDITAAINDGDSYPVFPDPYLIALTIPTARPWTAEGREQWKTTNVIIIFRTDDTLKIAKGINTFTDSTRAKPRAQSTNSLRSQLVTGDDLIREYEAQSASA